MRRRALLRASALGLATGLAGCQSGARADADPTTAPGTTTAGANGSTPAATNETTDATTAPSSVVVSDVVARESIVYPLMDTLDVAGSDGQFAFATVATTGGSVSPDALALVLDGEVAASGATYLETMSPSGGPPRIDGLGSAYAGPDAPGWVGFALPAQVDASAGEIRRSGTDASLPVPDAVIADLTAPAPDFRLDTLSVTDEGHGSLRVDVDVENRGERAETFRGCVNVAVAASKPFALDVPAGGQQTWSWTHDWGGNGTAQVTVKTVAGETRKKIGDASS